MAVLQHMQQHQQHSRHAVWHPTGISTLHALLAYQGCNQGWHGGVTGGTPVELHAAVPLKVSNTADKRSKHSKQQQHAWHAVHATHPCEARWSSCFLASIQGVHCSCALALRSVAGHAAHFTLSQPAGVHSRFRRLLQAAVSAQLWMLSWAKVAVFLVHGGVWGCQGLSPYCPGGHIGCIIMQQASSAAFS